MLARLKTELKKIDNPCKIAPVIILFFFLQKPLFGQRNPNNLAFSKGIILLDLHSSLGIFRDKERNFISARLPVFAGMDVGFSKWFGMGFYAGWDERDFKKDYSPVYSSDYYYYGLRFHAHFASLFAKIRRMKMDEQRVDIYTSIWGGRQTNFDAFLGERIKKTNFGLLLGTRIYPLYKVSVIFEVGVGPYGIINIGIGTKI